MHAIRRILAALTLCALCGVALAAPPLPAFSASYRLLRNGSPIGTASVTLARTDGDGWVYTSDSRGTSGLAALVGASTLEVSRFHWVDGLPQGDSYDYTLKALKTKHRSVRFDWASHSIEVDDHGLHRFASVPGAIERHTVALALAAGLAAGKTEFTLPVAVKDRIEMQHYVAKPAAPVSVPAGRFAATLVTRIDGGDAFEAWFAPAQLPVPVRIDQRGKDDYTLELERWTANP